MKKIKQIAYVLLILGGLNWGVYGLSGYDLVDVIFAHIPMIARIIYVLIGISAAYVIVCRFVICKCCDNEEGCTCNIKINTTTTEDTKI